MYIKENVQSNKVNAPILFIGVGGIGSKIVKGVADRAAKDDTSNIRFVVMDTDVNDLLSVNKGAEIVAVQTSSTSIVENYLKNDKEARAWFPENKMMDSKTVSEGAGQVRAISRLALNDIIKNGKIHKLYQAIDDLFLKDGGGLKQAVRVVIASTAAGGTGSGIAMETGMLVRNYVKKNYPEAAVMIRGFLVMPGVMDTVIKTQSEKDSLRCNGYATIKEINAFMMKGSGFFDTVPELQRYKDLSVTIPSASAGEENITNLPFDFCFLMDRTDSNAGNMTTLPQYIDYASQSIYEQNIGPMQTKASSVEDNILKLCINPDKLGRCRFAGAGASVLKYPYEEIRNYIALNWARSGIIGSSADDRLTAEERKAMLENSWLQYDEKFKQERKAWEENPGSSSKGEPERSKVYMTSVESGRDPKNGNDFSMMLWEKYLNEKISTLSAEEDERTIDRVSAKYVDALVDGVISGQIESTFGFSENRRFETARRSASDGGYTERYDAIYEIEDTAKSARLEEIVKSFAKEVFSSKAAVGKEDLGDYMLEKFLSVRGKLVHPNAARYLLYKLQEAIDSKEREADELLSSFEDRKYKVTETADDNEKGGDKKFEVLLSKGKESGLQEMCEACDKLKKMDNAIDNPGERCNNYLKKYYSLVENYFRKVITKHVCEIARPTISSLIKCYVEFYSKLDSKIPSIEKKKEDIVSKLAFHNGDCVRYVLGEKVYLDKLTASVGRPSESGEEASKLFAKIFESLRNNAYIEARRSSNPFSYESKKDIFDDIIVEYYKDRVDESCDVVHVKSIIHAIKLEHDVKASIEIDRVSAEKKEAKAAELYKERSVYKHINDVIDVCRNLASPGIKKKDNEEAREVNLIACNDSIDDGDGIRVSDFVSNAISTPTVSKYELCFYRAVYNIMPTQLAKLSAPSYDDETDEFSISGDNEYEQLSAGDYFRIYQSYMDKIGPNSKTSAVITPHVDKRWNAISSMPELDMEYQKRLMRKIHKSMLYGFVYGRIRLYKTSDQNPNEKVYKYLNSDNDTIDLVVSNKTKCDVLYEALDSLYFDRLAVATIREYVNRLRKKNEESGFRSHEDIEFFKSLKDFKFRKFVNNDKLNEVEDKVSLFTVVLMYCNALPVQNKDMAEMKTMVEAIIEMICSEMRICTANEDALVGKAADLIIDQYNCLMDNYNNYNEILRCGMFSEQVCEAIYRTICSYLTKRDLESYKSKIKNPIDN